MYEELSVYECFDKADTPVFKTVFVRVVCEKSYLVVVLVLYLPREPSRVEYSCWNPLRTWEKVDPSTYVGFYWTIWSYCPVLWKVLNHACNENTIEYLFRLMALLKLFRPDTTEVGVDENFTEQTTDFKMQ